MQRVFAAIGMAVALGVLGSCVPSSTAKQAFNIADEAFGMAENAQTKADALEKRIEAIERRLGM